MSEMIERVARAISPAAFLAGSEPWRRKHRTRARAKARDVLAAMREPTDGMVKSAADLDTWEPNGRASSREEWTAMIDEALR